MTTTNSPAGVPAYTAAQYKERIGRLYALVESAHRLMPLGTRERAQWVCDASDALSTERAHRTAEAAGMTGGYHVHDAACAQRRGASDGMGQMASESEVERARRLA